MRVVSFFFPQPPLITRLTPPIVAWALQDFCPGARGGSLRCGQVGLRCSGSFGRQTWPNDETPDGDAGPDKRMADEGSDRQMARNDRNEPTAVTDVACSLQTLMYSS